MGFPLGERDARGVVEDSGDVSINLNELVGLDGDPFISAEDLGSNPVIKLAICEGGEDVHNPLLGQPGTLLLVRGEVGFQTIISIDVSVDLPETEAPILGDEALADSVLSDIFLLTGDDVLQEVCKKDQEKKWRLTNGDMLLSGQVGLDLGHEQDVDLVLGRGLGGPGAREHPDLGNCPRGDLVSTFHNNKLQLIIINVQGRRYKGSSQVIKYNSQLEN